MVVVGVVEVREEEGREEEGPPLVGLGSAADAVVRALPMMSSSALLKEVAGPGEEEGGDADEHAVEVRGVVDDDGDVAAVGALDLGEEVAERAEGVDGGVEDVGAEGVVGGVTTFVVVVVAEAAGELGELTAEGGEDDLGVGAGVDGEEGGDAGAGADEAAGLGGAGGDGVGEEARGGGVDPVDELLGVAAPQAVAVDARPEALVEELSRGGRRRVGEASERRRHEGQRCEEGREIGVVGGVDALLEEVPLRRQKALELEVVEARGVERREDAGPEVRQDRAPAAQHVDGRGPRDEQALRVVRQVRRVEVQEHVRHGRPIVPLPRERVLRVHEVLVQNGPRQRQPEQPEQRRRRVRIRLVRRRPVRRHQHVQQQQRRKRCAELHVPSGTPWAARERRHHRDDRRRVVVVVVVAQEILLR
mmetsp:Transcript_24546/g.75820  ORF Transcript_24546/g.75820 Transcript_24546/m.75820 type:complete len:419 (-) Transcript_24546:3-1259(-)